MRVAFLHYADYLHCVSWFVKYQNWECWLCSKFGKHVLVGSFVQRKMKCAILGWIEYVQENP